MGNSQSNARSQDRDNGAFQSLDNTQHHNSTSARPETSHDSRTNHRRTLPSRNAFSPSRLSAIYDSFRRQPPGDHATVQSVPDGSNIFTDATLEPETRPLIDPEDTARSVPTTLQQAPALVRSQSTMSRLGTRSLPDPVMRGLLNSGEETAEEGEALRQGISRRRRPSVFERRAPSTSTELFHLGGTIRRRLESRSESRRSIRGPFPSAPTEPQQWHDDVVENQAQDSNESTNDQTSSVQLVRRRSRFARMRNSLSFPISGLFGSSNDRIQPHLPRPSTPHPGQMSTAEETDGLLTGVSAAHRRVAADNSPHELDAVEPETRNMLSASRITSGMTSIRRFPQGLRSRSTRLIRRGEHPPLSQVLQLAAAAIAAQLSGQTTPGADGHRPIGGEAFDGSIQNFVQTLQDAASAQAGENVDLNAAEGDLPPVNFMRVFQFPNDENGIPIASLRDRDPDRVDEDSHHGNGEQDRSVTLVLVGVRSMPNIQDGTTSESGTLGPSLDTLLSLPFLPPANVLRNGSSGALFRRSDTRSRGNRRHSMTNFNFPAQYESQRHHRIRTISRRNSTEQSSLSPSNIGSAVASESPPGPHPPPSTPADVRSGHVTPIRRPSSASAAHAPPLADLEEHDNHIAAAQSLDPNLTAARQRRRSDSEFARRPELGSGAARRNGVVEPDRPIAGAGRSWLIYVVGTNVSPDHPAFTMPSLFTDNPSYEDMQMLSTLLGPVKPPVATLDDVISAGGNYRLNIQDGSLVAHPTNGGEQPPLYLADGDRCLICLCDYELAEEIRQLNTCRHVFHRECIDEWLTTGRNSCPMCRGQGVHETLHPAPTTSGTGTNDHRT